MRLKKTKALRYVIATFLTIGTVLSVGFLSFSGLWIIYPYIIPAILAFFLSGVIEGKVYGTSIFKGLARLKLLTSNAEKYLLFSELNKFLGKSSFEAKYKCYFLNDYCNQRKEYKALKNNPNANEEDIQEAKKRLEELKDYFYQQLKETNGASDTNSYISLAFKNASINELKSAKRSAWFLRFFWVISILTGIVSGFVTAFAVQEAITVGLALSLSATALSAIVWPVAIFAAIGATFLLYYVITDIVKNDAIERAFSKTFQLFKKNNQESLGAYLFRLLALSIVVAGITALTLFATAASGGTSWVVMRKGIALLAPKMPVFVAYCASAILIPINFATDLIYGFSTTLQTINNCKSMFQPIFEVVKHPIKGIKTFCSSIEIKLDEVKQEESWGQFFNPFRILAKLIITPLQSLIFIGHLISIGLTTDRFFNVPPIVVAGGCAGSELLQDLCFFTTEDDHNHPHDHEDDGHDHGNLLQLPLQALLSPVLITVGIFYWAVKKCGNGVSFFDVIKQTFELPLLNIVFFPLLLLSAIWHWTFKKETNKFTFFELIKQSFEVNSHNHEHVHEHESNPSELSQTWREKKRPQWILNVANNRLNSTKIDNETAREKQKCLKELSSEGGLKYITNQLNAGKNIDEVLSQYTAAEAKKSEESSKPLINGYNRHSNGHVPKEQVSFNSILNKKRTFFQAKNTEAETTTLIKVKKAFSLVKVAAV